MPAIGWKLADGNTINYADALAVARERRCLREVPPTALMAMRETRDDGYWLSPSSAMSCPRQRILKMTEPYYQDLDGSWAPLLGNGVHSVLSEAAKKGQETGLAQRHGKP